MIINRTNIGLLTTGFKTVFNNAFAAAPSTWEQVAMPIPSTTSQETYAWLGAMPKFREWAGDRVVQNLEQHGYTIRNRPFEMTWGVRRDDIEDDQYGVYNPIFANMGHEARQHPDELTYEVLAAAHATRCYDGQNFFDTDHPVRDEDGIEQSVSNIAPGDATPWFLLDVTRPIKPFIFQKRRDYKFTSMDSDQDEAVFTRNELRYGVDARANVGVGLWQLAFRSELPLNAENYAAARAAMRTVRKDGGGPMNINPTLLVVPPQLEGAAFNVVTAEKLANGADNAWKNTARVLSVAYLG
jgi:phage major head subunit gpT-like protein